MKLRYKAVTSENKIVQGLVEAKDVSEAAIYLRGKEFIPIKIEAAGGNELLKLLPFINKVRQGDLVLFTRQLSSMLSSGLTLIHSLEILKEQVSNPSMLDVIDGVVNDVKEGRAFSTAISKYGNVFSPVYVSIIKSAETSGLLDKILQRLADNLEKEAKLKGEVKSALIYPIIVMALMGVVLFVMMTFVIPQLANLYKSLNVELPLPTKIIIGVSNFFVLFWPFIIGVIVILVFLYKRWYKTDAGRLIIDNLKLKIPIFGNLTKKLILTEFSRTLGLLVGSGALVVDSLLQASETLGNVHYKNAIDDVAKKVENGVKIGEALSYHTLFPPVLVQLVKIGEETGKLDEMLLKSSEYFERETDQIIKGLTTAFEPFIIVTLAVGVGFLLISIITPIYGLISNIK